MLILPMILAWHYLPTGRVRYALIATLVVLWIREILFPWAVIGYEQTKALSNTEPVPDNPVLCLVALGAIPYALASLFVLISWARFTRPGSTGIADR
jgi:hypothetical protein